MLIEKGPGGDAKSFFLGRMSRWRLAGAVEQPIKGAVIALNTSQ